MSEEDLLRRARVVLVRPQLAGNVGAAARIMRNLGLSDLVLVAPEADPADPHARQFATHGEEVLSGARVVEDLGAAVSDCVLVAATSARLGGLRRSLKVGLAHEIMPRLLEALAQGPIALVFGPERTGLSNEEVERCHYLIHIDTIEDFPALNLAQAVAICLHELRTAWRRAEGTLSPTLTELAAPFADFDRACEDLRTALEEIRYLHGDKADSLMQALRHLLARALPTAMEVRLLLGLARQLRWAARHLQEAGVLTRPLKPSRSRPPEQPLTIAGTEVKDRPTLPESEAEHLQEGPFPRVPGYELLAEIGRGGVGVVYRARHEALKREVALKMVLGGRHAGASQLARFRVEAEAIAQLHHPNIVQIYEIGEVDGHPYLALELVEGGSLAAHLTGEPWTDFKAAAELIATLAQAVHHAHSQGIIHRDLKPANILMAGGEGRAGRSGEERGASDEGRQKREEDGDSSLPSASSSSLATTPKVTDFGLAKKIEGSPAHTRTGEIMGTPGYMAPEQASGRKELIGPPTDVYALGAILYELLTGRPPFEGEVLVEALLEVVHSEVVPPRRLNPDVPPDLETICLKCLQKEPLVRYRTAQELADDLARFRRDEPILGRRPGLWFRTRRWVRHNPAVTALLLLVIYLTVSQQYHRLGEDGGESGRPWWLRFTGFFILPALPMASLVMGRALSKASRRTWVLRGLALLGLAMIVAVVRYIGLQALYPLAAGTPLAVAVLAMAFVVDACVLGCVLGVLLTAMNRAVRWTLSGDPRETMRTAVHGMLLGPFVAFAGLTLLWPGLEAEELALWTALGSGLGSFGGAAWGAWRSRPRAGPA